MNMSKTLSKGIIEVPLQKTKLVISECVISKKNMNKSCPLDNKSMLS